MAPRQGADNPSTLGSQLCSAQQVKKSCLRSQLLLHKFLSSGFASNLSGYRMYIWDPSSSIPTTVKGESPFDCLFDVMGGTVVGQAK
jgi:hypothetical protein